MNKRVFVKKKDGFQVESLGLKSELLENLKEDKINKIDLYNVYDIFNCTEEDLNLLKAISQVKNTTVNKTIMNILETTIETTRENLPKDFDVNKKAKEYDKKNKNKGNRKK